ncbi:MAG: hypothetical protein ACLFRU_11020 [Paracoccaceae bacterium]
MSDTAERRDDLDMAILAGGRRAADETRFTPDGRGTGPVAMRMRSIAPRRGLSVPLCGEAGPRASGGDISAKKKGAGA